MTDSRKRTRKGHLNKLSSGFGKKEQWNTYFFEALGGVYFHYRKDDRKEPTQILINSIVKVVPSPRGSVGTFEVHHKGKGSPWILDAETQEEMISWMEALVPDSSRQVKEDISRRNTLRALNPAGANDNNAQAQRYVQFSRPQQQQQYPQQQQPYPQQRQQYPQQQQPYTQQQLQYPQQQQPYPQQQQQQYPQQQQPYHQQQQQYPQQQQQYPQQRQPYPQQQQQYPQQQQQYPQQRQPYPQQQQQYPQQQQQYPQQQQPYPQQQQQYPQQQQQYFQQQHQNPQQQQYPLQQRERSYTTQNPVNGTGQQPLDLSKSLPADTLRPGLQQARHLAVRNTGSLHQRKSPSPISPPSISPRPYETFSSSPPPAQDGSYVIMTQAPEDVVPPPGSHTKGSFPSPKERPSNDQFRYFHTDQIPELAHLLENLSTAQGSTAVKPPINEKDQLDQSAVCHALGAVDLNLLEQTEDDDPQKKWTRAASIHPREEDDLEESDCMDSLSREALTIYKSQLSDMKAIGKGQYGLVFYGKLRYSPESQPIEVAVKSTKPSAKESAMKSFNKEIKTMASLCHPNVVKMYGVVEEAGSRKIVLEYLALGDLREFLKNNDRPVKRLVKYMYDVAAGMHYLASKGLVHRDLAARNVLVSSEEVCKVADMGLLREVDEQDLYMAQSDLPLPLRWMAPESIEKMEFSTASDVWSFGIFMWELFHPKEKHPYPEMKKNLELKLKVSTGYTMEPPEDAPPIVKRIMKECWKSQSDKRPSFLLISTLLFKCHLQLV